MDLLPEIETNTIMVMTAYPGASASDIEMNVSKPLENVLNSVSDLKHITSQSRENISIVTLEFNYGIDIDVATNDVRDKLDMVESSLPDDVENPIIFKFGTDDIPILILSVTAEESTNALYKILDDKVSNPLARISGVGAARAVAEAVGADKLIFLTDTDGILVDSHNQSTRIAKMDVSRAKELMDSGLIAGGMIPKTLNCIHAVEHGVGSVTVLDGRMEHAILLEAISEKSLGTTMEKKR